jgi:hypothetical protein
MEGISRLSEELLKKDFGAWRRKGLKFAPQWARGFF